MKPKAQIIFSPIWAKRIEVEIDRDTLQVTGWDRLFGPLDGRTLNPRDIPRLDIFKRLRTYALRHLGAERSGDSSGVYQFADATDDEKLVSFVTEFGPIWGKVFSTLVDEDEAMLRITVTQSLKSLRREQEIFAAAVKLLQQLNLKANADPTKLVLAMTRILPPQMRPPDGFPRTATCRNFIVPIPAAEVMSYPLAVRFAAIAIEIWCTDRFPSADKKAAIESLSRQVLCDLLNHHAPVLAPLEDEVIEMPVIPNEGIRDALYFRIRLDYLSGRHIAACLNCGGYFPVLRRGARACGEGCRTALRNQKYWDTHKQAVNRNRREKRTGRK
jgi:hypothetical protein